MSWHLCLVLWIRLVLLVQSPNQCHLVFFFFLSRIVYLLFSYHVGRVTGKSFIKVFCIYIIWIYKLINLLLILTCAFGLFLLLTVAHYWKVWKTKKKKKAIQTRLCFQFQKWDKQSYFVALSIIYHFCINLSSTIEYVGHPSFSRFLLLALIISISINSIISEKDWKIWRKMDL